MFKIFNNLLIAVSIVLGVQSLKGFGRDYYDSVVASVDGEPILLSEVVMESQFAEANLYTTLTGQELEDAVVAIRRQYTDQLINRILISKEFKSDEYRIDNQIVETALDDWAKSLNCTTRLDLERWARRNNTTVEELRMQVLKRMVEQYIIFRHFAITINVSPKEVYEYFIEHKEEFSQPEAIKLNIMYISSNRADKDSITKELAERLTEDSSQFAELTATYSDGPFRNMTEPDFLQLKDLRTIFAEALGDNPEVGKVYSVTADEGNYFLLVSEYKAAEEPSYEELQHKIKDYIEAERRKVSYDEYLKKLREQAIIIYY